MSFSPAAAPPSIAPVLTDGTRPIWSVMVPTFNCARYLRQTLESVLAQDPGPAQMQIEVVDDCSTQDDPEAVVREIGGARVTFYRKSRNEGAIANFNTCIERSRGHLVHILHGDDYVLPGFYAKLSQAAQEYPNVGAFFTRCQVVDESGTFDFLTKRLQFLEQSNRNAGELFDHNDLVTPGAVVRRAFYERSGGFLLPLVHCADWEMWVRAIQDGGGLFIDEPLAVYRFFPGNDTNRLRRSGETFRDNLRLAAIWEHRYKDFNRARFRRIVAGRALELSKKYREKNEMEASAANRKIWQELTPLPRRIAKALLAPIRKAVRR